VNVIMPGRFTNLEFNEEDQNQQFQLEAQQSHQRDENYYLARAQEEHQWGRFEKALQMYTRCLECNRSVVPAWVGQAQMLVQLGEYNEARLWSDKALELFRDNGELLATKAQACTRLKDYGAGMAYSDASLKVPGSSPWRWQVRGEALLAKRQNYFDECFQKSLNEQGADWFDRIIIAGIYLFYDRATNALQYVKAAMEIEPAHGYVWYFMGNCQAALGLTLAARTSYERCLEFRCDYREARDACDSLASMSFFTWMTKLLFRRIY